MKIIIAPHDSEISAAPKVVELKPRRALALAALALLLAAAAVYGTARKLAESWIAERAPVALALAGEIEVNRKREDARRAEERRLVQENQIAELHADIAELRGRGDALAKRLGLEQFVADAPAPACDANAVADGANNAEDADNADGTKTTGIAMYRGLLDIYERKYNVMTDYGTAAAVTFDTVPMQRPLLGKSWLSSRFGMRRDPFTGRRAFHAGYDYAARRGTPVLAAATGVVSYVGRLGNYGNAVRIKHGDGVSTLYGHLLTTYIAPGRYVRRGEIIAEVGSTGRSSGPHLHYEIRINNRPRPVASQVKKLRAARAVPPEWEI